MRPESPAIRSCFLIAAAMTGAVWAAGAQAPGVGDVHFPNSGNASAQTSFLTGLAQLHNFEYDAAAQLFRDAQKADPSFAMAYWGEAMTYNHPVWMQQDRAAAVAVLNRLAATPDARAAKAPTPREKHYLHAVEVLYGSGDKFARDLAYADAMAALHAKYPDDPDGSTFYALALLGTAHQGRDFAIYGRAAAILEPVFRDHPRHPGAAHYLIHSYDDPEHASKGLPAARAYSGIAPDAAHAQHMTSHIFVALGMWDDVVAANETAVRVVDDARAKRKQGPSACGHYNFWLEYGYLQQGRFNDAKKLVADCYRAAGGDPGAGHGGDHASMDPDNSNVGSFAQMRARYLFDTEQWTGDVASWTVAKAAPAAQVTLEFATGYAAVKHDSLLAAKGSLAILTKAELAMQASVANSPQGDQSAVQRAKILRLMLAAVIQRHEGSKSLKDIQEAAAIESHMPYEFGPPFVDKPPLELMGELQLEDKRPDEALAAFKLSLARTPLRVASLAGMMRAAELLGDTAKAAEIKTQIATIRRKADRR